MREGSCGSMIPPIIYDSVFIIYYLLFINLLFSVAAAAFVKHPAAA
jgi:hypothetical protein